MLWQAAASVVLPKPGPPPRRARGSHRPSRLRYAIKHPALRKRRHWQTGAPLCSVLPDRPSSHQSPRRTALALKVLHDERVTNHFGFSVGFIFCETTPKIDSLWQAVAAWFSIQPAPGETVRAAVLSAIRLPSYRGFLLLDNFETTRGARERRRGLSRRADGRHPPLASRHLPR